jgi:hypothetical protein
MRILSATDGERILPGPKTVSYLSNKFIRLSFQFEMKNLKHKSMNDSNFGDGDYHFPEKMGFFHTISECFIPESQFHSLDQDC